MGGHTVLARRRGNSYELATILVSWLLGAGYAALVVSGRANRELTRAQREHLPCPYIPDETKHEEVNEEVPEPKYKLSPLPDFRSKHEMAMEERKQRKLMQMQREEEERQQKIIDDYERLPPDEVLGYRRHAWVVVLPPCRGVEAPFYIEPSSGQRRDLTHEDYLGVDSVYDHRNYYINMQNFTKKNPEDLKSKNPEDKADPTLDKTSVKKLDEEERNIEEPHLGRTSKIQTSVDQLRNNSKHINVSSEKVEELISQDVAVEDDRTVGEVEGAVGSSESRESMVTQAGGKTAGSSESKRSVVIQEGDKSVGSLEALPKGSPKENVEEVEQEEPLVPSIQYDLWNLSHWEHLLPGESFECMAQDRVVEKTDKPKTEEELAAEAAAEKHLDMPNSWVEMLDLDIEGFQRRYPGGYKMVQYKKAKLELFAPYQRPDGLVKRVSTYHDYECQTTLMQYDWFLYRADRMLTSTMDFDNDEITETFERGREDFLKKHTYVSDDEPSSLEVRHEMEFFPEARPDHLSMTTTDATSFQEQFVDREDRLRTRRVTYTKRDPEKGDKFKRQILCIVEQYDRNLDIPANDDIATKVFNLEHDYIEMVFHYAYNFVTASSRKYTKPNLAETGGRMIIGPENITGYIASPNALAPRPLALYRDAEAALAAETSAGASARARSAAAAATLSARVTQLQRPQVTVQLFHTNNNYKAQQLLDQLDTTSREVSHREREAVADPLAPYLARLGLVGTPPPAQLAAQLREQCLNHFMDTQMQRETLLQKRIQKINEEYKQKRQAWFKVNQKKLQPEPEAVFIEENSHMKYSLHLLDVRLSRHQHLCPLRLQLLEEILDQHPMLENCRKSTMNDYIQESSDKVASHQ